MHRQKRLAVHNQKKCCMMNTAQKQWIRMIHVAKTKLNLDDERYRALLTEPTEKVPQMDKFTNTTRIIRI